MQGPEKNSYTEFGNEKKFLQVENSPPPPITFLMVRPLSEETIVPMTRPYAGVASRVSRLVVFSLLWHYTFFLR